MGGSSRSAPLYRTSYLLGGDGVEINVTRSALEPISDEYWHVVVDGFAPVPSGERRVEVPVARFAVTVPGGWWVRTRGLGLVDAPGAEQELWVWHPSGRQCVVWLWQQPPGTGTSGGGHDSFADAFVDGYRDDAIGLRITPSRLPAGPTVRVDDEVPSIGVDRATWLLTDSSGFHTLTCAGPAEPDDSLLPIADTFEFLPAEE